MGTVSAAGGADDDPQSLNARLAEADRRIGRLLDESAIENLQHSYGYYIDLKRWDDVAGLFADDAVLELGLQGVYRGRASIRRALEQYGPQGLSAGELNDHMQLETIVTVVPGGNTANARGIDFALISTADSEGDRAEWREAVFENTYVKAGGTWKIASMHLYPRFATDYALGWARDARPAPTMSEQFPADEPPTEDSVAPRGDFVSIDRLGEALTSAEGRLERAAAYDVVENIANAYNFYLDEFDSAAARALFAEDGSSAVINSSVAGGRESILEAIAAPRRGGSTGRPSGFMMIHQTFQPVILVADDGKRALSPAHAGIERQSG